MASQWKRDNSTTFTIRISNDTGLPDRIREEAEKNAISVSQVFIQAITGKFGGLTSGLTKHEEGLTTGQENGLTTGLTTGLTSQTSSGLTTGLTNNVPQPAAPTVPTYIPTDPLDIVAEAFYHQPYATLSFHGRGCCDFIADHPIMGPEMVLDAPPEYIKAGIEYMNNPTPVPIYQPKPSENNSKLTEIINTVNSYRAAKDEAFRQSLMEAETLYPDDGDSFFYCDSDDDAQEEVPDYSEEISEEN